MSTRPIIDVRREFSSKKGELLVNVIQKGSGYEVIATQNFLMPQENHLGAGRVEVWVTSGDESSNKVIRTMPQSY